MVDPGRSKIAKDRRIRVTATTYAELEALAAAVGARIKRPVIVAEVADAKLGWPMPVSEIVALLEVDK